MPHTPKSINRRKLARVGARLAHEGPPLRAAEAVGVASAETSERVGWSALAAAASSSLL